MLKRVINIIKVNKYWVLCQNQLRQITAESVRIKEMHSNHHQAFYEPRFHNIHYSQQIPTKEQQIFTLKTTITSLKSHNISLNQQRQNLKQKMKAMVNQVSNYHENVVQKVSKQNQKLKKEINQFKEIIKDNVNAISKLTGNISKLQSSNNQMSQRQNLLKQRIEYLQDQIDQLTQRWNVAQQTARGYDQKQNQMAHILSEYQRKNKHLQEQLAVLNKKYEKMILFTERTRIELNDYVDKEKFKLAQKEIKVHHQDMQKMKQMSRQIQVKNQILQYDRLFAIQLEQKTRIEMQKFKFLIQSDLKNLQISLKMQDTMQIEDLKSDYRFQISEINQIMRQIFLRNKFLQQELQISKYSVRQLEQKNVIMHSQLQDYQQQIKVIKSSQFTKQQEIANDYETKITKIQLQLKREEKSISKYQAIEEELNQLKQQYAHFCLLKQQNEEVSQFKVQRLQQQIEILEKLQTNTNLQLQQLTQENRKIPFFIELISNLSTVIPYFHCIILRLRQRNRKIYMPFMNYFFRIRQQFDRLEQQRLFKNIQSQHRWNRNKKLKRFRRCVYVVISIIRMKKHLKEEKQHTCKGKNGLLRYVNKAIESKDKYRNNVQKIKQMLKDQESLTLDTLNNIISFGKLTFCSSLSNFHKIQLHENDDINKIQKIAYNIGNRIRQNKEQIQET